MFSEYLLSECIDICHFIEQCINKDRLFHAYLLIGGDISIKRSFTKELAQILNCEKNENKLEKNIPCGECLNCKWIQDETHPDAFVEMIPKEDQRILQAKDIQLLLQSLRKSSQYYRVVFFDDISSGMISKQAVNSFLKTLEEPGSNILFCLCASDDRMVLPTVVSRCQVLSFPAKGLGESNDTDYEVCLQDIWGQSLGYFRCAELAIGLDKTFVKELLVECEQEYLNSYCGSRYEALVLIEEYYIRLERFCNAKYAITELLYRLSRL